MANQIRSRFDAAKKVTHKPTGASLTLQSEAKEADINNKVARHMAGPGKFGMGIGNPAATRQLTFGDVPSESYHEMLNKVTDVQNMFRSLPSRLRGRFNNNPYQLIRWIEDPKNEEQAVRMGLIENPEMRDALALKDATTKAKADAEAKKADEEAQPRYPGSKPPKGGKNEEI